MPFRIAQPALELFSPGFNPAFVYPHIIAGFNCGTRPTVVGSHNSTLPVIVACPKFTYRLKFTYAI